MIVRVYKLLDGDELIAQETSRTVDGCVVQKPLRLDQLDIGASTAMRLTRYLTLDNGVDCLLLSRQIVAISSCSQKAVDYYTKLADKCYTEIFSDSEGKSSEPMSGLTPEELISLITGKTSIQ